MHTLRTLLDESSYVTHANPHFISCGLRARLRNTTSRRSTICNTCAMTFRRSVVVTDVKFRLFLFIPTGIKEFWISRRIFPPAIFGQIKNNIYTRESNDYVCKRYVGRLLVRLRENYVKRYAYWFLENISLFKMGNLLCEE